MATNTEARRRKAPEGVQTAPSGDTNGTISHAGSKHRDTSEGERANLGGFGVVDVLRILGGILLLSCTLSYFITNESITWGWRPWFSKPEQVLQLFRGPIRLTDEELKAYDGSVEGRPIYVGLNGSIYDVTAGAQVYVH